MSSQLLPGAQVNRLNSFTKESLICPPGRKYFEIRGYFLIQASAVEWDPIISSDNETDSDITSLVIPAGARITRVAFSVPSTLVATTGNLLSLVDGVSTAPGSKYASVAAASSAIAAGDVIADQFYHNTAEGSDLTLKLYNTNATPDAAGAGVSSATPAELPFQIVYFMPEAVPSIELSKY
ncbi:MAG: hypothetical protein AAGA83_00340 [Cyanobacteria bacterium P01_F01_bin.116]